MWRMLRSAEVVSDESIVSAPRRELSWTHLMWLAGTYAEPPIVSALSKQLS